VTAENRKRILLVEDEPNLAFSLELNLRAENYEVILAKDGIEALTFYRDSGPFDLLILDVMLPEMDGFKVAKLIRAKDLHTGIIMLTARAAEDDRIHGLELGVDDYITKPFHLQELLLKVKRATERVRLFASGSTALDGKDQETRIVCGPFTLDTEALTFSGPAGKTNLTALEADVLKEFMQNAGRVLSREHLLAKVWGVNGNMETRTVDNFVMRLRRYIESDPAKPEVLESVRGRGYRFNDSQP